METAKSYQEPLVRQFSVFLPNRVGQLRELMDIFVGQGVHIIAFDVFDTADWAVVRAIFSDGAKARALLQRSRLPFTECQMLAVELASVDSLLSLSAALLAAELNLHEAYPLLIGARGRSVVAVHVDDNALATEVLKTRGFHLLDESEIWPSASAE